MTEGVYGMRRRILQIFITSLLIVSFFPMGAYSEQREVKIDLPDFVVSLNGIQVENDYRRYPLIVYKDITYFPMTYYDCRYLGMETKWDSEEGLEINKTGVTGAYRDYNGEVKNKDTYRAAIPAFDIKVNGKTVNNSIEEFPLLVFRDATYFPLTWEFGVEEFGWEYNFDSKNGLVIQSTNQKLEKGTLPEYVEGPVIAVGQHYYYGGSEGILYQTSLGDPQNTKEVYQLPLWSYGDSYVYFGLTKKNGEAWLNYHQGGASMGSDHYIRLNSDGTSQEVETGYLTFKTFEDITVKVDQWAPPGHNNLMIKYPDQEYERIGSSNYLYGWDYELREDSSEGGSPSKDIYLRQDDIYILAVDKSKEIDESRIYKVDIHTGETLRVSDLRAHSFKMDDENIYFISKGKLYKMSVDEEIESQQDISGTVNRTFGIETIGGMVYYVNDQNNELYKVGSHHSINPGGKVKGLRLEEDYLICTFEEDNSNPYRIIIIDKKGQIIFKSSDVAHINTISIEKGRLSYVENLSKQILSTEIRNQI